MIKSEEIMEVDGKIFGYKKKKQKKDDEND